MPQTTFSAKLPHPACLRRLMALPNKLSILHYLGGYRIDRFDISALIYVVANYARLTCSWALAGHLSCMLPEMAVWVVWTLRLAHASSQRSQRDVLSASKPSCSRYTMAEGFQRHCSWGDYGCQARSRRPFLVRWIFEPVCKVRLSL